MNKPERDISDNTGDGSTDPHQQANESAHTIENISADEAHKPNPDNIRINLLEQELDRTKDQMMRALAEAENARKRALREREDASKFAIAAFSKDLVSVADNLRRALNSIPAELMETQPELKNLIHGIEATERELLRSFEKNGIEKIEPLDQLFNPNFHEVMFEAALPGKPAGTIIQVIEAGYILNGRILRPARVGVVKSDGSNPIHSVDTQA